MSETLTWILGIIAFIVVFGLFILLDIRINLKNKKETGPKESERDNKPYYATTCVNCSLEFDFGDYDIRMYTDQDGKQHQITQCPRCKTYINVDP